LKLLLYFVCLEQLMKSITIQIIHYSGCKMNFFVFRIVVKCYKYTSKAAAIKLSFWVCWHIMLLICCRLQELEVSFCYKKTECCWRGLGHCMKLHLCVSPGVAIWLPEHCPRFSSTFHNAVEPVRMLQSEWWRVERNCKKVGWVNVFTKLNIVVCLVNLQCKWLCMAVMWVYHCVCIYSCLHLKELAVFGCCDLTDAGISMVICQCNQLPVVNLKGLTYITAMCALGEDPEPTLCFIIPWCMVFLQQVHHWPWRPTTGPYC